MLREARAGDEAAIKRFLDGYAETSMFLRSNLAECGLFDRQSRHGTTFLIHEVDGAIAGVLGRSNHGYLLCQCPKAPKALWQSFADWLRGQPVLGISGERDQVDAFLGTFGLAETAFEINRAEPFYRLHLDDFPARIETMRAPEEADLPLLTEWFQGYLLGTGMQGDNAQLAAMARDRAEAAIRGNGLRLLLQDGQPVSQAGLNARAGDTVQIGSVYTPEALRGKDYAGRAVTGLLQEERARGISKAVLFAASTEAARAYEKIGFSYCGDFKVALLKEPQIYEGPQ